MKEKPLVTIILGTRPEAIKLAPVISRFKDCDHIKTRLVVTGQHKEMVDQVLHLFDLRVQNNLEIMLEKQSLNYITTASMTGLQKEFSKFKPDLVLVQGDTTTAFVSALCAFYEKIPVGHIEAGLRTANLYDPYPEEANRRLISQIASLHFAPTESSKINLIKADAKGIIEVTGNTVIDSLVEISKRNFVPEIEGIDWKLDKVIFVTVHRRENWGKKLRDIINGLELVLKKNKEVIFLISLHPNPIVREPIKENFKNHSRVILCEPLDYKSLVGTLKNCFLILTDSGGLQEEAPSFGKPVLVLRETTERTEAINSGCAKLIGTNPKNILQQTSFLLNNKVDYEKMSKVNNPFGDGNASKKILKICLNYLFK